MYQTLTENVVSLRIGCAAKSGIDREMRLLVRDRGVRFRAILEQHDPSQERARYIVPKGPFSVGGPKIVGGSNGLFTAVIEVVAERWADLGFEFKRGHELAAMHHQHVP